MDIKNTEYVVVEYSQKKKNYKSPTMNCYGAVRELTQAGGSLPNESAATQCTTAQRASNPNCPLQ